MAPSFSIDFDASRKDKKIKIHTFSETNGFRYISPCHGPREHVRARALTKVPAITVTGNTGEQIREHKLACSIINLHGTEDAVFDNESLDFLKTFTQTRSLAARDAVLREHAWLDHTGSAVNKQAVLDDGSLSGLLIAKYGTEEPALDERDWELLDEWFAKGMPMGEHVER